MLQIMRVLHANQDKSCAERSRTRAICANRTEAVERQGEVGQMTISRLQRAAAMHQESSLEGPGMSCNLRWIGGLRALSPKGAA